MRYNWSTSDFPGHKACPCTSSANTHPVEIYVILGIPEIILKGHIKFYKIAIE